MIEAGADPITLIEPDQRFRQSLLELQQSSADVKLLTCTFEDADLESGTFELIVVATAFHWLAPAHRIEKISGLVRGGGYVALVWNLFQDAEKGDEFHAATRHLLEPLARSPSTGADALPFALDRKAREAEFCGRGLFERSAYAEIRWSLELDASQIRSLYQSFSSIARLPESDRTLLLDEISSIAADTFGGKVMRNMTTPIYLFRRRIVGYAD